MGIFVDLWKAFVTINHWSLCKELEQHGVGSVNLNSLWSYLLNRRHFVQHGDVSSYLGSASTGVPRGSILGPFLFLAYINDLVSYLDVQTVLYVDYTCVSSKLWYRGPIYVKENSAISALHARLSYIKLVPSPNQSNQNQNRHVIFKSSQVPASSYSRNLVLGSYTINKSPSVKMLGIIIDEQLSWHEIISHVCKKYILGPTQ